MPLQNINKNQNLHQYSVFVILIRHVLSLEIVRLLFVQCSCHLKPQSIVLPDMSSYNH